jgi:hypothetical protein
VFGIALFALRRLWEVWRYCTDESVLTLSAAHNRQAIPLSGDHFMPTGGASGGASGDAAWDRRVMRRARDVQPGMLVWALDGELPHAISQPCDYAPNEGI